MRSLLLLLLLLFAAAPAYTQIDSIRPQGPPIQHQYISNKPHYFTPATSFNKKRAALVIGGESALGVGSLIGLSTIWYNDYPQTSFHTFNDNGEWLQMDKCGHALTAYTTGRISYGLLRWSGVKESKATLYGGLTGFAYLSVIEMFDGFSSGWGFSWGDMAANTLGSGLFIGQQFLWHDQRIVPKFSFHQSGYAHYRPALLGSSFGEQLIKDYNGQAYWFSINVASFLGAQTRFPKWINVAVGYGASGMVGGHSNPPVVAANGSVLTFERYRQFYLAPDIDLTKIPVRSPLLKTVFNVVGFVKVPLPGLEFSRGKIYGLPLAF